MISPGPMGMNAPKAGLLTNRGGKGKAVPESKMGRNRVVAATIMATAILIFGWTQPSFPQAMCPDWYNRAPYGDYSTGSQRGWYGAKKAVRTADDARKILQDFFSMYERITIRNIKETQEFFEADILDKNKAFIDKVIVDKRTGRIRSIY